MTLGTYAAATDWADGERERLRALVEGEFGQESGETPLAAELPDFRVASSEWADSAA